MPTKNTAKKVTSKKASTVKNKTQKAKAPKAKAPKNAPLTGKALKEQREANRLRQHRFLEKNREEVNEKRRERYAARKESGQCPRCGKKMRSSAKLTLCNACLERAREYNQN